MTPSTGPIRFALRYNLTGFHSQAPDQHVPTTEVPGSTQSAPLQVFRPGKRGWRGKGQSDGGTDGGGTKTAPTDYGDTNTRAHTHTHTQTCALAAQTPQHWTVVYSAATAGSLRRSGKARSYQSEIPTVVDGNSATGSARPAASGQPGQRPARPAQHV